MSVEALLLLLLLTFGVAAVLNRLIRPRKRQLPSGLWRGHQAGTLYIK
jgi:hypothetical protein